MDLNHSSNIFQMQNLLAVLDLYSKAVYLDIWHLGYNDEKSLSSQKLLN